MEKRFQNPLSLRSSPVYSSNYSPIRCILYAGLRKLVSFFIIDTASLGGAGETEPKNKEINRRNKLRLLTLTGNYQFALCT